MAPDFKMEEIEENNYGHVFASDSPNTIIDEFENIHVNHSNAKIIMILIDRGPEDLLLLFQSAWQTYDMLNIIAVLVNTNSTDSSYEDISFFLYNPFIVKNMSLLAFPVGRHNSTIVSQRLMQEIYKRLLDVHQHPLRIGMFNFIGLAKAVEDEDGNIVKFEEPDGEIASIIAKVVNFKPIYIIPPEGTMYGGLGPNGSFTGVLELVENKEVDVTFNARVLKLYGQHISTFLPPIYSSDVVFAVPNIDHETKNDFLKILDASSLLAIVTAFVSIVIAQHILEMVDHLFIHPKNRFSSDIVQNGLFALGIMISIAQDLPVITYKRFLFISLALFSMITTCYYQANMVRILTTGRQSQNLKTLQDLAESKLNILLSLGLRSFLPPSNGSDQIYQKLYERHEPVTDFDKSFKRVAYNQDSAFLALRFSIEPYRFLLYSNETGSSLLYVLPEVPINVLVAYMVQKQCSFRERLNGLIMRIRESGLYGQVMRQSLYKGRLKILNIPRRHENRAMFTMRKLKIIFVMLSVCEFICIIVFCVELLMFRILRV